MQSKWRSPFKSLGKEQPCSDAESRRTGVRSGGSNCAVTPESERRCLACSPRRVIEEEIFAL